MSRFAALLILLSTAAAAQVTVTDDRKVTATFAAPPQRIVSLLPSITESVCALGACDRVVGTDRYSNWPESVKALPKLGGMDDAQIERILTLKPDVVLAPPSSRAVPRLEGLGLKVVVLESKTHGDVEHSIRTLAALLGKPEDGERLWAAIQRDIQLSAERVPVALRGQRVYFEIGPSPYAAGPGSFIGETLKRLGMANAIPPELGPFPKLNPEYVVRIGPDLMMAAQRSIDEMPRRPGWGQLPAVKMQHSCGFDPAHYELLIRPGPRLGEAAKTLADCLVAVAAR